jgi:hypothetical protein
MWLLAKYNGFMYCSYRFKICVRGNAMIPVLDIDDVVMYTILVGGDGMPLCECRRGWNPAERDTQTVSILRFCDVETGAALEIGVGRRGYPYESITTRMPFAKGVRKMYPHASADELRRLMGEMRGKYRKILWKVSRRPRGDLTEEAFRRVWPHITTVVFAYMHEVTSVWKSGTTRVTRSSPLIAYGESIEVSQRIEIPRGVRFHVNVDDMLLVRVLWETWLFKNRDWAYSVLFSWSVHCDRALPLDVCQGILKSTRAEDNGAFSTLVTYLEGMDVFQICAAVLCAGDLDVACMLRERHRERAAARQRSAVAHTAAVERRYRVCLATKSDESVREHYRKVVIAILWILRNRNREKYRKVREHLRVWRDTYPVDHLPAIGHVHIVGMSNDCLTIELCPSKRYREEVSFRRPKGPPKKIARSLVR